ncbi:MAG TPA: hypothetical protein VN827_08820 [Chthoniobacterales bacterium]|nr:hypothetical protein [Chthoniobacterales bacterium]
MARENPSDALLQSVESADNLFRMETNISLMMAVIEQAGIPALRVAFTVAVIIFLLAGVFIWRRRHQFFDRDPDVENDVPVVRHNREEVILFVWSGMTLVLIAILLQVWSA